MPNIQVLDKHTAELIAAGEVVERPSSVVKELLENTIDAGATAVAVEIQSGGVTYIRITDNGVRHRPGGRAYRLPAPCHQQSAPRGGSGGTSAPWASAARRWPPSRRSPGWNCSPAPRGKLPAPGTPWKAGEDGHLEDAGCPQGTTIVVRDLFYNAPARMKFLKKDVSEANAVAGVVDRIALSHPEVSFRFIRDGREELLTPGDSQLKSLYLRRSR